MLRRESTESVKSLNSLKSGSIKSETSQKSDADRLIDAIQQPLQFSERASASPDRNVARRSTSFESPVSSPKAKSLPLPMELKSAIKTSGWEKIQGSGTPLRPIRVPDDYMEEPSASKPGPRVLFEEPESVGARSDTTELSKIHTPDTLSVLVAEDDPINSKIMKKRLEKLGHSVYMTVNGEECSSAYGEQSGGFDAILMDLQMPIVDGFSSTKMIRSYEKTHGQSCLSGRARNNGRIPIFAVSASLNEKEREKYVQTGFDGWILKPVDFKRVELLLRGIVDTDARNQCLYEPGKWERGGWFSPREDQEDPFIVDTRPSQEKPTAVSESSTDEEPVERQADRPTLSQMSSSEVTVIPGGETRRQSQSGSSGRGGD
jgi:CheY-like chemotaxis protein